MNRKARALWPDLLAPGLLLATPFLIFLRDDAYPLLATSSSAMRAIARSCCEQTSNNAFKSTRS